MCRGMLESQKIENVETFISLSSPQGGQFGGSENYILISPQSSTHPPCNVFHIHAQIVTISMLFSRFTPKTTSMSE